MSIKSSLPALSLMAVAVLVAGCAITPPAVTVNPDADLMAKIAASAERASLSMQRLSLIRAGSRAEPVVDYKIPAGMDRTVAMNWAGPIDGLARKVAEISGYTYDAPQGPIPNTPVIVSLAVSNQSIFNILSDAGAQAGSAADIVVRPDARRISIKYPPVTRSGGYGLASNEPRRAEPVVDYKAPATGLDKPLTMAWVGPIEGLAKRVAELSGYTYAPVEGLTPKSPVFVSLAVKNQSALNILTEAGGQAGSAADIVVDPEAQRISIKYPAVAL